MLPLTQLTVAAALGAVVAAMLVAVVGAGGFVAAGTGVALAEHAASTRVAATASALIRRIPFIDSMSPHLLGNRTTSSCFQVSGSSPMVGALA